MAFILHHYCSLFKVSFLFVISLKFCSCSNPQLLNVSKSANSSGWSFAVGTWYGKPDGAGSDGGACGYEFAVESPPFNKMITATGAALYGAGSHCGACYKVKCTAHPACSGKPVTVTITDECPECLESAHFDLSGTAFGAMAKPGMAHQLHTVGKFQILYTRVPCNYPGVHIAFNVKLGSTPYFIATAIEYASGDGELSAVGIKQADGPAWFPMKRIWGGAWSLRSDSALKPPFSFKLTEPLSHKTVVASNVIPVNWKAGKTYRSIVNFD